MTSVVSTPAEWMLNTCAGSSLFVVTPSFIFCFASGGAPQTVSRLLAVRGVSTLKMGKPKADTVCRWSQVRSRVRAQVITLSVGERRRD
jgi:hypothetical protein